MAAVAVAAVVMAAVLAEVVAMTTAMVTARTVELMAAMTVTMMTTTTISWLDVHLPSHDRPPKEVMSPSAYLTRMQCCSPWRDEATPTQSATTQGRQQLPSHCRGHEAE